jgi:hypothetical protein
MRASATLPLRDFSIDPQRSALLCALALVVGAAGAALAKILLVFIGAITHLVYFGTFADRLDSRTRQHHSSARRILETDRIGNRDRNRESSAQKGRSS